MCIVTLGGKLCTVLRRIQNFSVLGQVYNNNTTFAMITTGISVSSF